MAVKAAELESELIDAVIQNLQVLLEQMHNPGAAGRSALRNLKDMRDRVIPVDRSGAASGGELADGSSRIDKSGPVDKSRPSG